MKKGMKLISTVLVVTMALSTALVGCKSSGGNGGGGGNTNAGTLKIGVENRGYGDVFAYKLAEAFEAKTGIDTEVTKSNSSDWTETALLAGSKKGVLGKVLIEVFEVSRVPAWFQEIEYATPMLLFYSFFFGFAGSYILFSGAMARISKDVQEAAALDGATMWQELWYIYIPLMWPTISMTIVTSFAGIFGATGPILLFTPNFTETFTFGYWIYDQVRRYNSYYIPSALGLIFTLIAYPLCLLIRKLVTSIYADVE